MNLLAIDTTGAACSVALRIPGTADRIVSEPIGLGHAERLAPMADEILDAAGLLPVDLHRIGVATGPGSFAGTRVGVAFARGLALATGAKAVGVGNLSIHAHACTSDRPLAVIHDARRGELVVQSWANETPDDPQRLSATDAPDHIRSRLGDRGFITGSGASLVEIDGFAVTGSGTLDLAALLDLVGRAADNAPPPSPYYARPPDAKLPGGRSL